MLLHGNHILKTTNIPIFFVWVVAKRAFSVTKDGKF